jgi:signal transduction histidine kinase
VTAPTTSARHHRPGGWLVDLAVTAVLGFIALIGTFHLEASASGERAIDGFGVACVVVAIVGVAGWRRLPVAGAVLGVGAAWAYCARDYVGGPIFLLATVTVYGVAVTMDRTRAYVMAAVIGVVFVVTSALAQGGWRWNDLFALAWPVVAVLVADVVRGQRERALAAAAHEADERRRREVEADRQRAEERLGLARDLHDSVAHAMATINVQAGVAAHVLGRDQRQTAEALEAIRVASRDVLDELGVMLDVLREGHGAPRQPVGDLAQLDALAESSRRAGVEVDLRVAPIDGVPPPVSAAAYRVVQEGLTNVARHAPGARAEVVVARSPSGRLSVEVLDDGGGTGGRTNGSGMGLVGVRERAEVTGGRCEIGPRPGGGFRLAVAWELGA